MSEHPVKRRKKLIEVAIPLDGINKASIHEKMPGISQHPRGIHHWWARRPFGAARAILFAQLVDDPSSIPELFPDSASQEAERDRLFAITEKLASWNNTWNRELLDDAKTEITKSWSRACEDNKSNPLAHELFDKKCLPGFHDPFAGGGAIPLEAQRLGLRSYATDLNPIPTLINKALLEIPGRVSGFPSVAPRINKQTKLQVAHPSSIDGFLEDIAYYSDWMLGRAKERIGDLYPPVTVTQDMCSAQPKLDALLGSSLKVVTWLWVRTVKSPNPAFTDRDTPLSSTFLLRSKKGSEIFVVPVIQGDDFAFEVRTGGGDDAEKAKQGTKFGRGSNFRCIYSGDLICSDYVKEQSKKGGLGSRLMAIVAEGKRERIYLPPVEMHERIALTCEKGWRPENSLPNDPRNFWTTQYGLESFGSLFTDRQAMSLDTLASLSREAASMVEAHAFERFSRDLGLEEEKAREMSVVYRDSIVTYLAMGVSRASNFNNSLTAWAATNEKVMFLFSRQAIPMVWSYSEANILEDVVGGFRTCMKYITSCLMGTAPDGPASFSSQEDAKKQAISKGKIISTDPPYYDNVAYADLSDFFYPWLKRCLGNSYPDLFATLATPKADELVATPYRHGGRESAERFFASGMKEVFSNLSQLAHPAYPTTIYYAFKQAETSGSKTTNTGWDTFLEGLISAGYSISATWPIRSEMVLAFKSKINALASSIVLCCARREDDAESITRNEFRRQLSVELPRAIRELEQANIAPVDLA